MLVFLVFYLLFASYLVIFRTLSLDYQGRNRSKSSNRPYPVYTYYETFPAMEMNDDPKYARERGAMCSSRVAVRVDFEVEIE